MLEQVPKDVTDASAHADLYSLVAVFLRIWRTTFLPCSLQLIDYQRIYHSASANDHRVITSTILVETFNNQRNS